MALAATTSYPNSRDISSWTLPVVAPNTLRIPIFPWCAALTLKAEDLESKPCPESNLQYAFVVSHDYS